MEGWALWQKIWLVLVAASLWQGSRQMFAEGIRKFEDALVWIFRLAGICILLAPVSMVLAYVVDWFRDNPPP